MPHKTCASEIDPGRALIIVIGFIATLSGFRMVQAERGTGTRQ